MPNYVDTFFQKEDDVLAVYDFDYPQIIDFDYKLGIRTTLFTGCLIPYCWPCMPCIACFVYTPMFLEDVEDATNAQHVAISRDGIRYVVAGHKTGCRWDCQDKGKQSKTVPFDKITDCDVQEPAGSSGPCCCMVENVLHVVNVDTASGNRSGQGGSHEITLKGLMDPHQFKKDVWAMKRGEDIGESPASTGAIVNMSAPVNFEMDRPAKGIGSGFSSSGGGGGAGMSSQGEAQLLSLMQEQNSLLKKQNKILKDIAEK